MTSTSRFEKDEDHEVILTPRGIIDKNSDSPFSAVLLGTVTGAWFRSSTHLTLYYEDGRQVDFIIDDDGDLAVGENEVPSC